MAGTLLSLFLIILSLSLCVCLFVFLLEKTFNYSQFNQGTLHFALWIFWTSELWIFFFNIYCLVHAFLVAVRTRKIKGNRVNKTKQKSRNKFWKKYKEHKGSGEMLRLCSKLT